MAQLPPVRVSVQYSIMQASVLKAGKRGRVWLAGLGGGGSWKGVISLPMSSVSDRPVGRPQLSFGNEQVFDGSQPTSRAKEEVVNPVSLWHGLDPTQQDH
jgi:hypothetical protein